MYLCKWNIIIKGFISTELDQCHKSHPSPQNTTTVLKGFWGHIGL